MINELGDVLHFSVVVATVTFSRHFHYSTGKGPAISWSETVTSAVLYSLSCSSFSTGQSSFLKEGNTGGVFLGVFLKYYNWLTSNKCNYSKCKTTVFF